MTRAMLWLALSTPAWAGGITLDPAKVVDGEAVTVTVDADGADLSDSMLKVTYRPNSALEKTVELPLQNGQTRWTPAQSGVATLSVTAGETTVSQNVAVGFSGVPIGGVIVFFLAGGLLFGGMAFAFSRLMQDRAEGIGGGMPLDT